MLCPCAVVFLAIYLISNAIFTQLQHKTLLCNPQSSVSPMSAPNRLSSRWRTKFICAAKVPKRVTKGQADHAWTHGRKEGRLFGDGALQCIDHWCSFAHLLICSFAHLILDAHLLTYSSVDCWTNWAPTDKLNWSLFGQFGIQMWSV